MGKQTYQRKTFKVTDTHPSVVSTSTNI